MDGHSGEEPDELTPVLEETLPLIQHSGGGGGGGGGGGDSGGGGGSRGGGGSGSCGGGGGGSGGGSCCGSGGGGGSCGGLSGDVSDGDGTFLNSTIPLARREDHPAQPNSVLNLAPQSRSTASRGGVETRPPSGETCPPPRGELEDPVQDTVGVVVLDRLGHVASSVSSGGIGKLGSHPSHFFLKFKFACANNKFEIMLF